MHALLDSASAVFFDLDGTLVDSAADIHASLNQALLESSLTLVTETQVRGWIGRGAKVLVESALNYCESLSSASSELHVDVEKLLVHFLRIYNDNVCQHTRIYDGVLPVLCALKQAGKSLACITNKPILPATKLLDTLDLSGYFTLTLGGDSLAEKKPHPLPLQHALSYYSLNPSQALMIGDSKFDVLAAQAANIPCIGVLGGYNHGVPLEESNPSAVVSSFLNLL